MSLQLYGDPASPYVMRVIMYARLKGLELEIPPVPGGNPRSAAYHELNPLGKVPGLMVDGEMIPESEVICEYLEDAYPQNPGLPTGPWERAISRIVARTTDLYISPGFNAMLPQLDVEGREPATVASIGAQFEKAFKALEFYMGPGPFCVGMHPTLGDCALGPYIKLLQQLGFPDFEQISDPTVGNGRLANWWQAMRSHAECGRLLQMYEQSVQEFLRVNRSSITRHS